ncbi:MAG: MBL fold metallo-hydrolase [Desulfarculus sp.]|nr:MBL fold metallo-hydrolase [Desulfarculus sp.]
MGDGEQRPGLTPRSVDPEQGPVDIGQCRALRVTCLSEVGWWDDQVVLEAVGRAGGLERAEQWTTPWDSGNAAGCCHLIEVEGLDGSLRRILLDAAWNPAFLEWRLQATGVAALLEQGQVDLLYLSHEHMDHFWGLEAVLRHAPELTMMVPSTLSLKALKFIFGGGFAQAGANNRVAHHGQLLKMPPGPVHLLWPGCASVTFDLPIILGVRGEQSLYFNVQDKGIVCVTGCCHQGVTALLDFARQHLAGGQDLHGLYGGLHLAPFGQLSPQAEEAIFNLEQYGLKKLAVNHCTGLKAVELMRELAYPVEGGRASQGSQSPLYLGNGDTAVF